ncbi:hypothetical protein QBZ16_002499 [Prototheca wickerhamii]|uniref:RAP domain-containing protein n=1 Tax=Prototheca wickerhamii TaxID=3111 RepID=A0AAD9MMS6_PROWI|nr:hypothetical protein QBZ16_002499 [Prototheca wickerhamii]
MTSARDAQTILDIIANESDKFDSICMATAIHRLAGLKGAPNLHAQIVQSPAFFKLKKLMLERRKVSSARNISNTLWSLAKMNHHPGDEFLQAYAEENAAKAAEGNAQNTANTLWAFATLGYNPGEAVLRALSTAVLAKVGEFTAQNISNTLGTPGPEVVTALARETVAKLATFVPQAMSNSLWALSKLELLRDLAAAALRRLPEFSPQNLSNTLWGLAKLGVYHRDLFEAGVQHAMRILHTLQPQTVANTLWAFAALDVCPDPAFVRAVTPCVARQIGEFSPQNLSNTAWALATLKEHAALRDLWCPIIVEVIAETHRRLVSGDERVLSAFSRQHLSNTLWALATLEYDPGKAVMAALGAAQATRVPTCIPQEMANSVWAFARLGAHSPELLAAVARESVPRIAEYSPQNLSNLVWSFAKIGFLDAPLMEAATAHALAVREEMALQHLSNVLWAYATFKFTQAAFQEGMRDEVKRRLREEQLNLQQISNMLWSMAVLEILDEESWRMFVRALEPTNTGLAPAQLPAEALSQVFQALMLMQVTLPDGDWGLPEDLRLAARNSWLANTKVVTISEFHSEVSRLLLSMGVAHDFEHLTQDRLFSVDIALSNEKIALEVDGPHHFTVNTLEPMADMYWRRTLLRARGWRVVSVPFYHWSGTEDEDRKALLRRLIAQAREEPAPEITVTELAEPQAEDGAEKGLREGDES